MIYCKEVKGHKLGDSTVSEEVANRFGFVIKYNDDDVEKAWDGTLWERGYAPIKPAPTQEEIKQIRRQLYIAQKDPITCQIQSLKDEEQTEEVIAEIKALMRERSELVAKIKEENPYPTEE